MTTQTQPAATVNPQVSDAVREVIRAIDVAPDRCCAVVEGVREITADTPRELRRMLSETIYNVFHAGQPDETVPSRLRDRDLEKQLSQALPHREITVRAKVRSRPEEDAEGDIRTLVEREGIRFWAPSTVLGSTDPQPGDIVDLRMPAARPALSPGFFLVDSPRQRKPAKGVLRVYFHIDKATHVVPVWQQVLSAMEARTVPYRAKVLSSPELYPRRDAIVVYLDGTVATLASGLAELVAGLPGIVPDISAFTRQLGPGVATAWEPTDTHPGHQGLSFGQHRATVLATALVEAAEHSPADPARTERIVAARFADAAIDPVEPADNLSP